MEKEKKLESILSKAIDLVAEKGHYERNKGWRVYDEKEPKGKFLGIFQKYEHQFTVVHEKTRYRIGVDELDENVTIYDRDTPVFRASAASLYDETGKRVGADPYSFHINSYVPGEWERHLDDLYSGLKK